MALDHVLLEDGQERPASLCDMHCGQTLQAGGPYHRKFLSNVTWSNWPSPCPHDSFTGISGQRRWLKEDMRKRHLSFIAAGLSAFVTAAPLAAQETILSWNYNSFGIPGMIDMPTAHGREDGELGFVVSHFQNQTRTALTFQVSKRLSATFRYALINDIRVSADPASAIIPERYDRSFSLQYRLFNEARYMPAIAVGVNDLVGTGVYGGEYIVATKTLTPQLRATAGLGWGRLGSHNGFGNPLSVLGDGFRDRPTDRGDQGGTFKPQSWFRGDAAFFGGIEWQATDKLRLTVEYSSDAYAREAGTAFERKSPVNLGLSYQHSDRASLDLRYMYGAELGLQLTYALNPKKPRAGSGFDPAPPPIVRRPFGNDPESGRQQDEGTLALALRPALQREGLVLEGVDRDGDVLRVQIRNDRYGVSAQAVGRAARILTQVAPGPVETFDIRLAATGMPVTSVTLRRADLEELEFHPVAPDLLRSRTVIVDEVVRLPTAADLYPMLSYGIEPYLTPSLFDPDDPLRMDIGLALKGQFEPAPGILFSGKIHQKLIGNLDEGNRPSTSVLPRVRSEAYLYYQGGDTTIPELTAAYYFRPGGDLFGRFTLGYLETMFGGLSGEMLWKPQNSSFALGLEVNHVKQRDFDQLFGFQDYSVTTGHISAYYDFGRGILGQLDVGRYLAGDVGATVSLAREFGNGWRIGAFATKTDVSAADFGEGSFDKGITLTVPLDWVTGSSSKTKLNTVIRPVQRDGGARLNVSGRLYETVRGLQATQMDGTWGRFWR